MHFFPYHLITILLFMYFLVFICSLHFHEDSYNLERKVRKRVVYVSKKLKDGIVPTNSLPSVHNISKTSLICALASSESEHSTPNSPSKNSFNNKNYSKIRSNSQLEYFKTENEKLPKMIAELEGELKIQIKLYKSRLKFYNNVRNSLKEKLKNVVSRQQMKDILSKVFSKSQSKILMTDKKSMWSDADMAVAYTIRHLSNDRCYKYLINNMNIPLPGLSTIHRWIQVKNLGKKMSHQKSNYLKLKIAKIKENTQISEEPLAENEDMETEDGQDDPK